MSNLSKIDQRLVDAAVVRFDEDQTGLNSALKEQARNNIGIGSGDIPSLTDTSWLNQSHLKTAQSENSTTNLSNVSSLPGGAYGFAPTTRTNTNTNHIATFLSHENVDGTGQNTDPGSAQNVCRFFLGTGSGTIWAAQRYIQASPPYDLGDGEIPLFVWVLVEKGSGKVLATQVAPEAPWHNNGPTPIRPDAVVNGKKLCRATRIAELGDRLIYSNTDRLKAVDDLVATKKRRGNAIDIVFAAPSEMVEIDQTIKQRDMPLLSHPWTTDPTFLAGDAEPVLLDPVCKDVERLAMLCDAGESVADLLHKDGAPAYLRLGNSALKRSGPNGVKIVSVGWL